MGITHLLLLPAAALVFASTTTASAATWADPTRPAGAAAGEGAASTPRAPKPAASAPTLAAPRLQSIQVGTDGSASALVDGRVVRPGDTLGAQRIGAIDADGLTLLDSKGHAERLSLLATAIVKRNSGVEPPMASASEPKPAGPDNHSRPSAAGNAARPHAAVAERLTGREGQRP